MHEGHFHQVARSFLKTMLLQRIYLLGTNRSRKKSQKLFDSMEILDGHLSANKYDSDEQMARFWLTHSDQIEIIMPGRGSINYENYRFVFESLSARADQIQNHPDAWWEALMRSSAN
jgi:hypothetical protein